MCLFVYGLWGVIHPYGTHSGQQIKASDFLIQVTVQNSIFTSTVRFPKSENQWKTYVNINGSLYAGEYGRMHSFHWLQEYP